MGCRHYFAAGNTAKGFVNYFSFIGGENGFLYILKGGAGTGKSTLMKKIGKYFEEKGFFAEYFYCASDPESLDGVRIPAFNCAVVDGTAPHITECRIAGATDEIVNLGEFIGGELRLNRAEIEELLQQKKSRFDVAAGYLRAAGEVYLAEEIALQETAKQEEEAKKRAEELLGGLNLAAGEERKLFLSALLPSGLVSLNGYLSVINLDGDKHESRLIMRQATAFLRARGYKFTFFSSILNPSDPQALEIGDTLIHLGDTQSVLVNQLLVKAANALTEARTFHKKIEAFYAPVMNFEGLNAVTGSLIRKIEGA